MFPLFIGGGHVRPANATVCCSATKSSCDPLSTIDIQSSKKSSPDHQPHATRWICEKSIGWPVLSDKTISISANRRESLLFAVGRA